MGPRQIILLLVAVSTLTLSGCGDLSDQAPTTVTPTTTSTTTLSDAVAKDRALEAEEAYLETQLRNASCLKEWGTYPTTATENATVVNRTPNGVIVEVKHPYSYSTGPSYADGLSHARYLITPSNSTRLSGDQITPC